MSHGSIISHDGRGVNPKRLRDFARNGINGQMESMIPLNLDLAGASKGVGPVRAANVRRGHFAWVKHRSEDVRVINPLQMSRAEAYSVIGCPDKLMWPIRS